jgi:signal transduction histidine kinase/CheY-like chemotaxis protein
MDRGVSVYRPWFDIAPGGDPVITILGMDIDAEPAPGPGPVTMRGSPPSLTFHFRAVSFVDEKRTRVEVRLDGYDNWFPATTGDARYSHVPPGEYHFQVRAAGPSGEWTSTQASGPVTILAPLRHTAFFRILMGAVAVLIAYAIFLFVSSHRYARRLRREVDARVAELRTVEAELDRARRIDTIGVLAAGIAHDFNNLLAVIIGNLSLVKSDPGLDADTADGLEDSLAAGKRARALARQLLTFARGGSPVLRTGSMAGLLRESVQFLLSGSNVGAHIDLPDDMWAVEMDIDQMSQVVNNLLINAQQAMPEGGVITVGGRNHETRPHPRLPEGRYVEVFIRDAGTGIREEHIDRIFDPYFSTRKGGTGLGLTTAYSIVSRHDGLLTVDSKLDVGTVFHFYLPASDQPVGADLDLDIEMYRGTGSILVMDDEEAVRTVLERILSRAGYEVALTSDGAAAVALYRERLEAGRGFDIVIMDLTVPGGMGGREALDRLQDIDPAVRAIVASGYSTDPVMANHRKFGFVARGSKPFSINTLLRAVARTIRDDLSGRRSGRS